MKRRPHVQASSQSSRPVLHGRRCQADHNMRKIPAVMASKHDMTVGHQVATERAHRWPAGGSCNTYHCCTGTLRCAHTAAGGRRTHGGDSANPWRKGRRRIEFATSTGKSINCNPTAFSACSVAVCVTTSQAVKLVYLAIGCCLHIAHNGVSICTGLDPAGREFEFEHLEGTNHTTGQN